MKAKTISVYPNKETSDAVVEISKKLRTSQGGFCEIALEFVLPLIEEGKMKLVNGKLEFTEPKASTAAA